ncbi:NAD-dependent epimerase/dehydratase family protein [Ancylobacter lacus]|uniref:NAD-dependent epimerase/dehydratase family protein n=1 Tax=Ancylobacter lacus TaxID=2579970 RepID=UPI001BCDAE5F|nr:NAD-dependent epimerase/dehydratase family protein [Ancylobacter lacus]MBS7539613.1 NAD-dependent dehydratase [Ancylobacter lacus]
MTMLLCLGYGYCAQRFVARHPCDFTRIVGTTRDSARRAADGVEVLEAGEAEALAKAAEMADAVLVSAAPGEAGDPFAGPLAPALEAGGRRGPIVYLSTIGVYGSSDGAWIDETDAPPSTSARGVRRLEAEGAWQQLGARLGRPVAVLRLGGIYGPGRNALADLREGTARCIERPGQVFNRIHVDDIATAIAAAFRTGFSGVVNVVDDEPAPSCAPVRHAAALLGIAPPPSVPYEVAVATMSPMARSFWEENRRVRNDRLRQGLGVTLTYPSYREGLDAIHAAGA